MLKFRWETEFKKTEMGEIPKDWEVRKLGEVVCMYKTREKYFNIEIERLGISCFWS
jgi:hypothetical protein